MHQKEVDLYFEPIILSAPRKTQKPAAENIAFFAAENRGP